MQESEFDSQVSGVATLKDPTRQALYRFVAGEARPVTRDEAATAVSVPRSVAAFHLDRLTEAGLLEVEFRRLSGRQGPGAGRPSKLYRRSEREVSVSLPERRYDVVGRVLARAVSDALAEDRPIGKAIERAATDLGKSLGDQARLEGGSTSSTLPPLAAVTEALETYGFEPLHDGPDVVLNNCPFHSLAQEYPDLVCGMNVHLMRGLIRGLGARGVKARLDPSPGRCCVRLHTS